jgi:hypothetical protein
LELFAPESNLVLLGQPVQDLFGNLDLAASIGRQLEEVVVGRVPSLAIKIGLSVDPKVDVAFGGSKLGAVRETDR